ncbi:cytochrome P450 [Actinomadura livida]|uniref:Cytochrome P450 n=1 Tax=Actinomadura livida TaxID=79909 RepID=A0A7W7MVC5_9ACTN|nr:MULTISPECIES: cytochrome P450 [Actinomadura]MBB4772418.1 cytochrome P450 [Actinomadura catellatispora]GGU23081.1 cytochrome P450 [Actinomadura livida]
MTTTVPATARRAWTGPPRTATPAMLRKLLKDRIGLMSWAANTYGDAVKLSIGPVTLYFVNHPDHAKHVLTDNADNYHKGFGLAQAKRALGDGLLTSEGELWRKQRKVIQPAFQHRRMARYADVITDEAAKLVARLRERGGGGPVQMTDELTGLTLGVLGRTLLDADLGDFDSLGASFEAVQDQAMFEATTLSKVPVWVPLPKQVRLRRARRDLQRVVDRLVTGREVRDGGADDDVLSRLIVSTRQETDHRVGRQRMRDELVTLLLAGHETTASTLGWTLWLLDRHPEVLERVRAEAVQVLGDRAPKYEDLHGLTYTSTVIQEVMRLYPPVWMLSRLAQADDRIDGLPIPAGANVMVCPYTLHRHPAFWDDPERFDPDRFAPEVHAGRPRYAYIPFGAGPRFCVGNHLGMMEATFVIAMLARELRLAPVQGYRASAEPMLSLRMRGGLPMTVTPL